MRYVLPLVVAFTMSAAAPLTGCANKSPSPPTATPAPAGKSAAAAAAAPTAGRLDQSGHPVIVRIASRDKTLVVSSTGHGPVYSVLRATGETLLSEGTLDDLRHIDPQLYQHVKSAIVANVDSHEGVVPEFGHSSAVAPIFEPIGIMSAR